MVHCPDPLENVKQTMASEVFSMKVPNKFYALIGGFARANTPVRGGGCYTTSKRAEESAPTVPGAVVCGSTHSRVAHLLEIRKED